MAHQSVLTTAQVLESHSSAIDSGDLDRILADYAPDAVLLTPDGAFRGHDRLRDFFRPFLQWATEKHIWDDFEMIRQEISGEIAYIVWKSGSAVPLATDTFLIQRGKITAQTFTVHR